METFFFFFVSFKPVKVISGSQESRSIFSILYITANNKHSIRPHQGCSKSSAEAVMHVCSFAKGFIRDAQDGIKPRSLLPKRAWSGNSVGTDTGCLSQWLPRVASGGEPGWEEGATGSVGRGSGWGVSSGGREGGAAAAPSPFSRKKEHVWAAALQKANS